MAEGHRMTAAGLGERAPERCQTQRNGYRQRRWDTRVGEIELAIPRLRTGSYFPSFLEPRRRAEQALVAVVQEAYVNGISTRKVDRLVEQLGAARHEQGHRQPTVPRAGRAGRGVRGASVGRRLSVLVAERQGGAVRGIFTAATAAEARQRLGQVVDQLRPHAAKVARLLEDAEAELLAFSAFPAEHWSKLRSTNPLERVNREKVLELTAS